MRVRWAFVPTLIATFLALETPSAAAGGLIYVEGSGSALATLDPTTGAITVIGQTSELLGGLGFDATAHYTGWVSMGTCTRSTHPPRP